MGSIVELIYPDYRKKTVKFRYNFMDNDVMEDIEDEPVDYRERWRQFYNALFDEEKEQYIELNKLFELR